MYYDIYQVKNYKDCKYSFIGWELAEKDFSINDYRKVYSGCINSDDYYKALNSLFEIFNIRHPNDFYGSSMSVSDVIILKNIEKLETKVYYCDSFGWKDITDITIIEEQ